MKTLDAIKHLQGLLAKRFGKIHTASGAGTLYIARDRAEITGAAGTIKAHTPSQVVRVLRRKRRAK